MFFNKFSALLLLSTGATSAAQPPLRDPFGAPPFGWLQALDTGGAITRALHAAPVTVLVRRGGVGVARWNIAGHSFVFVRGGTADSVGAGQGGYFVYEVVREDSVRLVFSAPYREYSDRAPGSAAKPTELRACLYLRGTQELAYVVFLSSKTRHFVRPSLPRDGYYRWKGDRHEFVRASDVDSHLRRTCASASG
jgi:hypothetical protein